MTRLFLALLRLRDFFTARQKNLGKQFSSVSGALLGGLRGGGLLGSFRDLPRAAGWWDGAFIFGFVLFAERITRVSYAPSSQYAGKVLFQFFKLGVVFAVLVDGLKVGS